MLAGDRRLVQYASQQAYTMGAPSARAHWRLGPARTCPALPVALGNLQGACLRACGLAQQVLRPLLSSGPGYSLSPEPYMLKPETPGSVRSYHHHGIAICCLPQLGAALNIRADQRQRVSFSCHSTHMIYQPTHHLPLGAMVHHFPDQAEHLLCRLSDVS